MMRGRTRAIIAISSIGILAVTAVGALSGIAAAVSGGGYSPDQQDCPWNASAWSAAPGYAYPGCHNVAVNVESGGTTNGDANSNNTRYVEFGNDQVPNDPNSQGTPTILSVGLPGNTGSPHSGCVSVNTDGTGGGTGTGCGNNSSGAGFALNYDYYQVFCPLAAAAGKPCEDTAPGTTTFTPDTGHAVNYQDIVSNGLLVYFGMDDNTDNGEHDGVSGVEGTCPGTTAQPCHSAGVVNGPSDGGGMLLSIEPQWLINGGSTPTATHPEGLVNFSEGECADGICSGATTQQQTVYYGCGATNPQNTGAYDQCTTNQQNDDVFKNNTPASLSESPNCSSGDAPGESCGGSGLDPYRQGAPQQMNTEPGVQTYQDPDPQRSPAAPFGTPGTYVGTCGVYVNDNSDAVGPGLIGFLSQGNVPEPPAGWVIGPTDSSC
ncbi:MAG TPA: hypothetical protein DCQ30_00565 [Acidimicrobiaceae bacterium]|nr:hypothetical protein [Acidimicrobiaceae bacterium]